MSYRREGEHVGRRLRPAWYGLIVLILAACTPVVSAPPATATPLPVRATATPLPVRATATPLPVPERTNTAPPSLWPTDSATPACGEVVANSQPKGGSGTALAAFTAAEGLGLYDVDADTVSVLDPLPGKHAINPRFRTAGLLSFVGSREGSDDGHIWGQDSLYELDLESGEAHEMLRLPDGLLGYDWSPDGTRLAYQVRSQTTTMIGANLLCQLDTRSGETSLLRSLEPPVGRGGHQRDEQSVAWSTDGAFILVVDTGNLPTLWVVQDGLNVELPQLGTFGRWLSRDAFFFQEGAEEVARPGAWHELSVMSSDARAFGLPAAAFRPAVSPSGTMVAYDDGAAEPSIHVFDIYAGTSRRLASGYVAPVWLGPNLIAATAAGPCPGSEFCVIPWSESNATIGIDPTTGHHRPLSLPTTLQQSVAFGVIDVFLPAT